MNPLQPANQNSNKKISIIIAAIIALLIIGGIAYALTNNQEKVTTDNNVDDSELYLEGEDIPTPPAKSERTVNATIKDTDTNNSITATKIVINAFALPKLYAVSDPARTVVLVEYTATNSGQFSGAPSGTKVDLITANGTIVEAEVLSDEDISQTGYEQMSETGPKVGTSITGYVVYLVPTEQASGEFSLQYIRPKTTVINGDDLPEKTFIVNF